MKKKNCGIYYKDLLTNYKDLLTIAKLLKPIYNYMQDTQFAKILSANPSEPNIFFSL